MGEAKPQGAGERQSPTGSRGGAPLGSLGTKSPRSWSILKVVKSKLYAFLVVIHTFSPMPMFFPCRHHSTKSKKWWGHLILFAPPPLSASGEQLPLCLTGSCAYAITLCQGRKSVSSFFRMLLWQCIIIHQLRYIQELLVIPILIKITKCRLASVLAARRRSCLKIRCIAN